MLAVVIENNLPSQARKKNNIVSKNLRGQMVLSGQWVATAAVNMANI